MNGKREGASIWLVSFLSPPGLSCPSAVVCVSRSWSLFEVSPPGMCGGHWLFIRYR